MRTGRAFLALMCCTVVLAAEGEKPVETPPVTSPATPAQPVPAGEVKPAEVKPGEPAFDPLSGPKVAPDAIPFTKDKDAPPPADIFAAAKGGDLEAVRQFIERDPAQVHALTSGRPDGKPMLRDTPLHWAASCGHADIVKLLLLKGADPNAKNISDSTPLHLAARMAHLEVMKVLIDAKTDLAAADEDGATPLHLAVMKGNADGVELLLNAGSNVNTAMKSGARALDLAEQLPKSDVKKLLKKKTGAVSARTEEE